MLPRLTAKTYRSTTCCCNHRCAVPAFLRIESRKVLSILFLIVVSGRCFPFNHLAVAQSWTRLLDFLISLVRNSLGLHHPTGISPVTLA